MEKKIRRPYLHHFRTWLLLAVICLLAFVSFEAFGNSPVNSFDKMVFDLIAPHRNDGNTRFMKFITFYGNHVFLLPANILLVLYFILRKNKWMAIDAAAVALSSLGVMVLLKKLTHRIRPGEPMIPGITNFSFPSGHAFMSVAFYGFLVWLAVVYMPVKWQRYGVIALLVLLMLIIGISRVYLRVHYATDVIAGYCMGIIWLMLVLWITYRIKLQNRSTTPAG